MDKLYIGTTERCGRGVFAAEDFSKGDLIESAHVIVVPESQISSMEPTILRTYLYLWGSEGKDGALGLGLSSLYNHSANPNAEFIKHIQERRIDYVALRDIKKNEEIFINYDQGFDRKTLPSYFDFPYDQ